MQPVLLFLIILAMIAIGVLMTQAWFRKSRSVLAQWAQANGFVLLRWERRYYRRGPYLWTSSKFQDVYYVIVQDRRGRRRSGFVRCGSFWWGLSTREVSVQWD